RRRSRRTCRRTTSRSSSTCSAGSPTATMRILPTAWSGCWGESRGTSATTRAPPPRRARGGDERTGRTRRFRAMRAGRTGAAAHSADSVTPVSSGSATFRARRLVCRMLASPGRGKEGTMSLLDIIRKAPTEKALVPAAPFLHWDPFRSMRDLLAWDPFREVRAVAAPQEWAAGFAPDLEIKETKESYVFRADLPGVLEKDLEIGLLANRLTI